MKSISRVERDGETYTRHKSKRGRHSDCFATLQTSYKLDIKIKFLAPLLLGDFLNLVDTHSYADERKLSCFEIKTF